MTHFPIALFLFSTVCDFASLIFRRVSAQLRAVSFYALLVAALASFGAIISGIALVKGDLAGRGDIYWHHRFVWPAFGLLVGLAVWRVLTRETVSRMGLWIYLALMLLSSGLIATAGFFGGEILLGGG